ncbi:MAG: GNAT family N-acetyltransferase [Isosphaeraceae bacterium]|nr:GNAT family N-acetyltransferase [Isosphaeraceae bacterium]
MVGVHRSAIYRATATAQVNAMEARIIEEPVSCLPECGRLPIAFRVDWVLDVIPIDEGLGGLSLKERPVDSPYIKDFDEIEGNAPMCWAAQWDLSNWSVLSFLVGGYRVGGAVLAFDTEGVDMLERRKDLAILWDIRVHPDHRRHGVGRSLFRAAEAWAGARGCQQIKVETQNINVAACHFYAKQGCSLGMINRYAYRDFPEETQIIWYKQLL